MTKFLHPDDIRSLLAQAESSQARHNGTVIELDNNVSSLTLAANPGLRGRVHSPSARGRMDMGSNGAIRVGTANTHSGRVEDWMLADAHFPEFILILNKAARSQW